MTKSDLDQLLRSVKPAADWANSEEGRRRLEAVLSTPRSEGGGPTIPGRRGILIAAAALGTAAVVGGTYAGVRVFGRSSDRLTAELDTYHPADVAFFRNVALGDTAREAYYYESLAEGANDASAVLVGEVVAVRHTRTVVGEVPTDRVHGIGVVVRPVEVLRGSLPDQSRNELTVDFMAGGGDPNDMIAKMRAALPQGESVWFLRSGVKAAERVEREHAERRVTLPPEAVKVLEEDKKYYFLVSSQGLFVQGDGHVANPVASSADSGMVAQGQHYQKLSELVAFLRELR